MNEPSAYRSNQFVMKGATFHRRSQLISKGSDHSALLVRSGFRTKSAWLDDSSSTPARSVATTCPVHDLLGSSLGLCCGAAELCLRIVHCTYDLISCPTLASLTWYRIVIRLQSSLVLSLIVLYGKS